MSEVSWGAIKVHVPDDHKGGHIELPGITGWRPFQYEEKLDLVKHFAINQLGIVKQSDWSNSIRQSGVHEALIFVHGFNTTFNKSVYRTAQIMWDLQYRGLPILFAPAPNSTCSRVTATSPVLAVCSIARGNDRHSCSADFVYWLRWAGKDQPFRTIPESAEP